MEDQHLEVIQESLKETLDHKRFRHTQGVMYTAAALAMCHGQDVFQAMLAGILHDCAKCLPKEDMPALCEEAGIPVSQGEQQNPELLHAKLGAYLADTKYKVSDQAILNAICCHTTGRPAMSKLDKILYIADYIEPGRKALPHMEAIRQLAFQDLDACLFRILESTLSYLKTRDVFVDPLTEEAYQYYQQYAEGYRR